MHPISRQVISKEEEMRLLGLAAALLLLSLALSTPGRAAIITNTDLPSSIQSCITATTCSVSYSSEYDSGTASAFGITENTGSGPANDVLMRYALTSTSGYSNVNPTQSGTYNGYLWVLAQTIYSASETAHPITLFLDKVSPTPLNLAGSDSPITMTTTDMIGGGGYLSTGIDMNGNVYANGDLAGGIPAYCLAPGCSTYAQLNLVQLTYGYVGNMIVLTTFNPSDARGLVFEQSVNSSGSSAAESFNISAVPISGAAWLFGSGLLGLIGVARRKSG